VKKRVVYVLVTGGAGFIGSHLVDALVEKGYEVRILDNLDPQVHTREEKPDYLAPEAEFIEGDVRDEESVIKALEGIEVVFHLAAAVGVGQSMYQIKHYMQVNTLGTAVLLEHILEDKSEVKKLIVASSMSIYGEGAYLCPECGVVYPMLRSDEQLKSGRWEMLCPKCGKVVGPIPTPEDKPLYPTSIYAISKRDQEEMCLTVGRAYGLPTVALRYFNVYGPRQSLNNPYTGVAAIFSSRIKNNNPPPIYEDGLQTRDFVYVKDIVKASILSMEKHKANYKALNVGTGKPVSIREVAETLIKLYGKSIKPKIMNRYRSGDIRHCYADISKIKKLGFKPEYSFEEGMKELVSWAQSQEAVDMTEKAMKELVEHGLVMK